MKIILGIFCALVVLFAGGCAVILLYDGGFNADSLPLALIPAAVAGLNVVVLAALLGQSPPRRWAFYTLAAVDFIAAGVAAVAWASMAAQMADAVVLAVPVIGLLVLKGVLTLRVAR